MTESKNNPLKNILADLKSDNKEDIITAIKQLRIHGQKEAISDLLDVYIETTDDEIKKHITTLLFDLKDEQTIATLIKAANDKKYNSIKPFLISIFWQSALDGSEYLNTFIRWATKGDYTTCLEVLSVVESFDSSFDEEQIQDAIYDIEEKLDDYEIDEEYGKLLYLLKEAVSSLKADF